MPATHKTYKLPKRYAAFVMPLFLSILMTCIVSAVSTVRSLGFTNDALHAWPGAWLLSWLIAFPCLLLVLPLVRRLVAMVVED